MKTSMNPIDGEVGKKEKEGELEPVIPHSRAVRSDVVHLAVSPYFSEEKRNGTHGHDRYRFERLCDLELNLVLQKLRVFESLFVENEVVRKGAKGEVHEKTEKPIGLAR